MTTDLDILASSISEVGHWRFWDANLPSVFQIEFGCTTLYQRSADPDKPPFDIIALNFTDLLNVSFLKFSTELGGNWIEEFHEDIINCFHINQDSFCFNDNEMMEDLCKEADEVTLFHGSSLDDGEVKNGKYKLAFSAGEAGLIVVSDTLRIFGQGREIPLDQIKELSENWWEYWEEYWKCKKDNRPLPYDEKCEVIFPLKG